MTADPTPESWRRLSSVVERALELPPERRAAFLDKAFCRDASLRERAARVIEAAVRGEPAARVTRPGDQAEPFSMAEPGHMAPRRTTADLSEATTRTDPPGSANPVSIGPYRFLEKLGEGGMGEVWLADQASPVRRRVAVKVIKAGMDTKQVIARFEAERQALAMMDHPGIAKVFDAGATVQGRPYFVMEHVKGEPITVYCDRQRLTTRERIELIGQVCEAVQHAHQKGVIHRDLKPSNILVTIQGERATPVIIDFGLAKATAQKLTERTLWTEVGALVGTPEYMSPEQASLTGLDVDTRTDVYGLGAILYQLLTGVLPFEWNRTQASYEEIRRRILEEEPPRPSSKVRALGERLREVARVRKTEPVKLVGQLKGDLDWIVMKALEKDRTRRYGSAAELKVDLDRHLKDQPVAAGPPRAAYRARKFVRRHRVGVAAATMAAVALVGFAAAMAAQAARIAAERDRANTEAEVSRQVSEFMTGLFAVSDPSESRGNSVTAREILDRGAEKIEEDLADSPEIQARLMRTMGEVYLHLGLMDRAEQLLKRAVEVQRQRTGSEHPDVLAAQFRLAWVMIQRGQIVQGEDLVRRTLEAQRRVLGPRHPDVASSMSVLAIVCHNLGRLEESEQLHRDAIDIRREALGPEHRLTLGSLGNLATVYMAAHRWDDAEKMLTTVLEVRRRVHGGDDPGTLTLVDNLVTVYFKKGRFRESARLAGEVVESRRRVLGPEHPDTLRSLADLANAYRAESRLEEAERLSLEALESQRRLLQPAHRDTLRTMETLAWVYLDQRRYDDAERLYLQVLDKSQANAKRHAMYNLACVAMSRGRAAQSIDWLERAIAAGFAEHVLMAEDAVLEPLHDHPQFVRLLAAAKQNFEALAPGE